MTTHEPVLVAETLALLQPERGGTFVDCTVGLGGHARALLEAGADRVIGLDRDQDALARAQAALAPWAARVDLVHADYRSVAEVLAARGLAAVDGALADLGVSSMQLDDASRGFSFRHDAPLDMRMDRSTGPTAADLLRTATEAELADVIFQYGEERYARRIARRLVDERRQAPIETTTALAALVRRAVPQRGWQRIDPATRTFQALRIWVNRELEELDRFLRDLVGLLRAGARVAVIAFHSLEDRIVKRTFRALGTGGEAAVRILTKRPLTADEAEISRNPRARSAKLRAAERLA
jgi:16S rRNA (cytosine1402-N4)-methyltransferase